MITDSNEFLHSGVKGMKWGIRRYQNPDGSLTDAGKRRYQKMGKKAESLQKKSSDLRLKAAKRQRSVTKKMSKANTDDRRQKAYKQQRKVDKLNIKSAKLEKRAQKIVRKMNKMNVSSLSQSSIDAGRNYVNSIKDAKIS